MTPENMAPEDRIRARELLAKQVQDFDAAIARDQQEGELVELERLATKYPQEAVAYATGKVATLPKPAKPASLTLTTQQTTKYSKLEDVMRPLLSKGRYITANEMFQKLHPSVCPTAPSVLQTLFDKWENKTLASPEDFQVGLPKGSLSFGLKLVCVQGTRNSRNNEFLKWIIPYCDRNNITSSVVAIDRGALYTKMDQVPEFQEKYPKGVHGGAGSILHDALHGKIPCGRLNQTKGSGNRVLVWVTPK